MSAFLVWLALLLFNRFNLDITNKKLIRPLPILSTIILFTLGLIGHASAETNNNQLFPITSFPCVSLEEIYVTAKPQWWLGADNKEQLNRLNNTSASSLPKLAVR